MVKISNNQLKAFCLSMVLAMSLLPFIHGFHYIDIYATNVPYWDQWDTIVPWVIQYHEGNFHIFKLIGQQNDSRPFVSNAAIFLASLFTDLDIKFLFYLGYICYAVCIIFIIYFIKSDISIDCTTLLLSIPIFYYSFNSYYMLRFIQNIGSVQYPIMLLFSLATIYLLYRSKSSYSFLLISILTGILCTFSFAAGLSIWFAGLGQLVIQRMNNKSSKILLWIGSALAVFYIYYVHLGFRSTGPHGMSIYFSFLESLVHYPMQKFLCIMGTLGAEVIHQKEIALYFGLIIFLTLIALVVVNRNSLQLDRFSKWYGTLMFGTLTSIEVALARSGDNSYFGSPDTIFFIPDARHSLAIFLPLLCIYILTILYTRNAAAEDSLHGGSKGLKALFQDRKSQNLFLLGIVFTLLSLGIVLHTMPGLDAAGLIYSQQTANEYYLHTYRIQTDENLKNLNPTVDAVRKNAALLERYNLSIFSKDLFNPDDLSLINDTHRSEGTYARIESININTINGTTQTAPVVIDLENGEVEITGWAMDKRSKGPAGAVFISIDNEMDIPSIYGLERPDVSEVFNNEDLRHSGFRAVFSSSILAPGPHNATLKVITEGKDGYYLSGQTVDFVYLESFEEAANAP